MYTGGIVLGQGGYSKGEAGRSDLMIRRVLRNAAVIIEENNIIYARLIVDRILN